MTEKVMPRIAVNDNGPMPRVRAAKEVFAEAEQVQLSEHDSLRVLILLENPPAPNARLLAAAKRLPRRP
jgi:uncharacterized protein (DUF1778 family)